MRYFLLLFFSLFGSLTQAQPLFSSDSGTVSFFSSAPFEDIDATSHQLSGSFSPETGELFFEIPIKSFEFPNSLMQKHFNNQYMESDTYPKASFKGKVTDLTALQGLGSVPVKVPVRGQLTIRDITKTYTLTATLASSGAGYQGKSSLLVKLKDHDVKIPKLMFKAIVEEIEVNIDVLFLPKE